MENHTTKRPPLGKLFQNYFDHVFSPKFTGELITIFGKDSKYLIREFLFGMDCLVEIINDPDTPTKRMLNNVDVTVELAELAQVGAGNLNRKELTGCQVGSKTTMIIEDFFDGGYLPIINYVLTNLRAHLIVPVDNGEYSVSINRDFSPDTGHAILYFRDMRNPDRRFSLPFNRTRLTT